jgi:hypothetical protein
LVAGHSQLAYDEDVQWKVESAGDFKADWNTASGQGKNYHVFAIGKFGKAGAEHAAGFKSICKQHREPLFRARSLAAGK